MTCPNCGEYDYLVIDPKTIACKLCGRELTYGERRRLFPELKNDYDEVKEGGKG